MNYWLSAILLLSSFFSYAEDILPQKCRPIPIPGESVVLGGKKSMLILIHNISNNDLWITHPVTEPSASAGWNSQLAEGQWSALVVDKKEFAINCIESKPGHEQQIPCQGAIAMCEWTHTKLPGKSLGTYWAVENKSLAHLSAQLGSQGFKLPESD